MTRAARGRAALLLALACASALTGCAPKALGFEHDDTIRQGFTASNGRMWGAVSLDNATDDSVTLQSLRLTGLNNMKVSSIRVIRVTPNNHIGISPTDTSVGVHAELANGRPLRGFELPPRSRDLYQAAFLLAAADPTRDAMTQDIVVTYASGGLSWSETRRSSFCLAVVRFHGCAAN